MSLLVQEELAHHLGPAWRGGRGICWWLLAIDARIPAERVVCMCLLRVVLVQSPCKDPAEVSMQGCTEILAWKNSQRSQCSEFIVNRCDKAEDVQGSDWVQIPLTALLRTIWSGLPSHTKAGILRRTLTRENTFFRTCFRCYCSKDANISANPSAPTFGSTTVSSDPPGLDQDIDIWKIQLQMVPCSCVRVQCCRKRLPSLSSVDNDWLASKTLGML